MHEMSATSIQTVPSIDGIADEQAECARPESALAATEKDSFVTELIVSPDTDAEETGAHPNGVHLARDGSSPKTGPSAAAVIEALKANVDAATRDAADLASGNRRYKVVQIGCGVVGHAYAQAFVNDGHDVVGIEASRARMEELSGAYPMRHICEDLSTTRDVDFVLLSINTPLDPTTGALNMRYLWSSVRNVCALLDANPNALVIVRSTVTIGFCAAYRAALRASRGVDARVCFQPEFLRAKSALNDATAPWQVVVGTDAPEEVADYVSFQARFIDARRIALCSIDEAEIMKIFHNSFNAMKISFFNQAHLLIEAVKRAECKRIDSHRTFKLIGRTCEGLLNPEYGLTPGHAYYGTCLPKDSAELAHMEKAFGLDCNLFAQVVAVNDVMRASDEHEVLHGDNHADNALFHERSAPSEDELIISLGISEHSNSTPAPNGVKSSTAESPTGVQDSCIPGTLEGMPELEQSSTVRNAATVRS